MISFLVPIFNRDVTAFVNEIYRQAKALEIPFDIVCYDDFSAENFKLLNRSLSEKMGISYMEMSSNLGRSRIRNRLGKNARYDHIVFMDCDSQVETDSFVKNYIDMIGKADLVYGGTSYQKARPDSNKLLHWKYGKKVESLSVAKRIKSPYRSFRSNNFMIDRNVFLKHMFDEKVEGYGYEDILLGESLREAKRSIIHIDNPLLHDGLETNAVFLDKTDNAISNLVIQYKRNKMSTRLTEIYAKLHRGGFLGLFKMYDNLYGANRRSKLVDNKSSLFSFQMYKLSQFIKLLELDKLSDN